jgi:hypothetical protein
MAEINILKGLREFEPGVLPATLDLGDKFDFEGASYQVKSITGSGWVRAQRLATSGLMPEEFIELERTARSGRQRGSRDNRRPTGLW